MSELAELIYTHAVDEQLVVCLALLEIPLEETLRSTPVYDAASRAIDACWTLVRKQAPDPTYFYFAELGGTMDSARFWGAMSTSYGRANVSSLTIAMFGACFEAIATSRLPNDAYIPHFASADPPVEELEDTLVRLQGMSPNALAGLVKALDWTTVSRSEVRAMMAALKLLPP